MHGLHHQRFWFFFPFIFISWRLITLQYSSGFCHTLTWISQPITCVPHPDPPSRLPPHPIPLVFPVHQPWALVSCIHPGLVICFTLDNIHVSMLFSQRFWFNWCGGVIWAPGILKSPQIFLMCSRVENYSSKAWAIYILHSPGLLLYMK